MREQFAGLTALAVVLLQMMVQELLGMERHKELATLIVVKLMEHVQHAYK